MRGLTFQAPRQIAASAPHRADIACFVGLVARRASTAADWQSDPVRRWLEERGWAGGDGRSPADLQALADVPVPVESWNEFDRLFAWNARDLDGKGTLGGTYLGAAVRSFFVQGGKRCYVVRVADPPPLTADRATRLGFVAKLIPTGTNVPVAVDRRTWRGIGHLFGLPDVSFVALPDLPDLVGLDTPPPAITPPVTPAIREQFVECSPPGPSQPGDQPARLFSARRCDADAYDDWRAAVQSAAGLIMRALREVQLLVALPLPQAGLTALATSMPPPGQPSRAAAEQDLLTFLRLRGWLASLTAPGGHGLGSAFVQLAFPWLRTSGSATLPEQLESPDGALAGMLARNAILRGTFRSATTLPVPDLYDVEPKLPQLTGDDVLEDHVCLFGPTVDGLRLLSDVTTSPDPTYAAAGVSRLVAAVVRAARLLGEALVFESSNEALWARIAKGLRGLLTQLWRDGALDGETPADGFTVRCDASTMTQNDIDNGRVVCQVELVPAAAIDSIEVVLVMTRDGSVSLAQEAA